MVKKPSVNRRTAFLFIHVEDFKLLKNLTSKKMKNLTLTVGLVLFALFFQHCKNNTETEQELVVTNETKNSIEPEIVNSETENNTEITVENTLPIKNEVPIKNNDVKPVVNTSPKTTLPKITETKEIKTIVETPAPIIKDEPTPTPKEEVIVNEPAPKPVPKPEPKPIAETPVVADVSTWVVPANYKTMKNPTDATDKENLKIGKELYTKHCSSCHGKSGLGDGSKASELNGDLGNFSSAKFQKQTDGELFYKLIDGRDDMPGFKKKLPSEEDRWLVINYIRTLKK